MIRSKTVVIEDMGLPDLESLIERMAAAEDSSLAVVVEPSLAEQIVVVVVASLVVGIVDLMKSMAA